MSPIALSDVPNRLSPTRSPEIAMYLSVMIFYQWKVETNIQNQNKDNYFHNLLKTLRLQFINDNYQCISLIENKYLKNIN